jgi:uncharacterized cupin superfamily protein
MTTGGRFLVKAEETERMEEYKAQHPLNPIGQVHLRSLSHTAGMQRLGVHLARLAPGKEANEYHTHHYEEEFYYIVSGRGVAFVDGVEHQVGPGDFLGFTTPSVPHVLRNSSQEDLIYLIGGERREFEVADFPRHEKILIREGRSVYVVDKASILHLWSGRRDEKKT